MLLVVKPKVIGSAFVPLIGRKLLQPKSLTKSRPGTPTVILDTADQELALLHKQRAALEQQKRGLMQRLLTGKIRVTTQSDS